MDRGTRDCISLGLAPFFAPVISTTVTNFIESKRNLFTNLSDRVWELAESRRS